MLDPAIFCLAGHVNFPSLLPRLYNAGVEPAGLPSEAVYVWTHGEDGFASASLAAVSIRM